jgi:hypothetical protein
MRGDPKAVARGQLFPGNEIGVAECVFSDHLAAMSYRDNAAGLLRCLYLKFEPVSNVFRRKFQPWFHLSATTSVIARIEIPQNIGSNLT